MTEDKVINTKMRRYKAFESGIPRERIACPKCESVCVKKVRKVNGYKCESCGWIGQSVKKLMW